MATNPADKYAKKTFGQLESQMSKQYREAYKDISKKLQDFTRRHKAKDKQMQRDLKKGKITQEQYASWLRGQVFIGQQWQDAKASLDLSIKNVMEGAAHLTHQKSIDVFVDNANYTAYQIEKDHGFTGGINFQIYDRKTVSRLMLEDPELLPRGRDINGNKLSAWNTKVIANCVTQSILQGESIDELSKRIARDTCIDAGRSSLLYARTAMTGAQNAGRVERMREAEDMGIKVQKQWMSTLDSRTRDSHRDMDGEIADTDEEFSNGLEYPGDFGGDPSEVYNCRCTLIYHYPEYSDPSKMERTAYYEEGDPEYDPDHRNYETVKGMNYEQWTNYKQDQIRQRYNPQPEDMAQPEENEFIKRLQSEGMTVEDAQMVYDAIRNAESIDEIEWLTGDFFTYDELEEMWEEKQTWDQEESKPEETIEEMVGRLKKIEINEDWMCQPEPGQEKDMRENLVPFVGAGKDMEISEKIEFDFSTRTTSIQDSVEVRISDLKTIQPMVDIRGVERALYGQAGMGNPVKVVEYNGQMYIVDGNHRVNAAILRGDETINVQLIEKVDKQPSLPKLAEPAPTQIVSAEHFVPALDKAKASCPADKAWRVDTSRSAEDFKRDRITTYITPGGSTFALKDDGDIISVCKNQYDDSGTNAKSLLAAAVEAGGTHLDSFDGNYGFYVKCGFEPVSRCRFDEEYAPPGWVKGRDQPEDIYFMRYVGVGNVKYVTIDEARTNVPYSSGYDEAEEVVKKAVGGRK